MKLFQWNIWYKEDIRNILSFLKEIDADIVCLQELTFGHPHYNSGIDTAKFIAAELGFNYIFQAGQKEIENGKEAGYGNGIFSRFPIVNKKFEYIQNPQQLSEELDYSKEGRVYLEAAIDSPIGSLTVGTTHMSYTDRFQPAPAKNIETDKLIEIIREKKNNFIFTGDLNSLPDSYTINEISKYLKNAGPSLEEKTWTTKPFSYRGFEANALDWRLDYCFVTPDIKVKSAEIIKTDYSDHLPILIEI